MIFEIIIGVLLFAVAVYYCFCLIELLGIHKWTPKHIIMESPKWLIPFYYFFKGKD